MQIKKIWQTLEAWFEVVCVSSFRACWFIHVCFAPGPRLQGKEATVSPSSHPEPRTNPKNTLTPESWQSCASLGGSLQMHVTVIKGWPLSTPRGSWQSPHRRIIQGKEPTREKGIGAHVCDSFQHTNSMFLSFPPALAPGTEAYKNSPPLSAHMINMSGLKTLIGEWQTGLHAVCTWLS